MKTDINTKFICLIGTPLGQSFAARMQNAAYDAADMNLHYFYSEADQTHLKEIIDGVRYNTSFAGCAVTKPNKVEVLKYLDEFDPLCKKMGACNTVVKQEDGKLKGYNTDGEGFIISLKEDAGIDVNGKSFFCFGAGGAGRAICSVLAYYGAKEIVITDINQDAAKALANDINTNFANVAKLWNNDKSVLNDADVIINASGVGMGKTIGQSPIAKEDIPAGKLCFDACYNPAETQFLKDAKERDCKILNGLGMSLYQGVAQIRLWAKTEPPIDVMKKELETILKEKGQA